MEKKSFETTTNPEKKDVITLQPSLIVFSGVPLTGKTTFAERVSAVTNAQTFDVDVVRHEIDETRKKDTTVKLLAPEKELAVMCASYAEMCARAAEKIKEGTPALMVGTFSRAEFKQPLEKLLRELETEGVPCKIFLLTAADQEIEKRIKKRKAEGSMSPIDSLEKYQWAKGFFKKIEFAPVMEIDVSETESFKQVLEELNKFAIK